MTLVTFLQGNFSPNPKICGKYSRLPEHFSSGDLYLPAIFSQISYFCG